MIRIEANAIKPAYHISHLTLMNTDDIYSTENKIKNDIE